MAQKVSNPKVTVNKLPATLPAGLEAQKILVIGQKLAAGNAVAGQLYENIGEGDIVEKFGDGSMLQGMLEPIFKVFNDNGSSIFPKVDVIALDDAGGGAVKASSTIVISATAGTEATLSKTIKFTIAGREYEFNIVLGETIAGIGARLETLLTDTSAPFTSSDSTNTVTQTARNEGTVGMGDWGRR